MIEYVTALALTFAAGNQGHQQYHFPVEEGMTAAAAEAACRAKEEERRTWVETQVRDGGVQRYSLVACHPQEAYRSKAMQMNPQLPRLPTPPRTWTEPWRGEPVQ